MRDVSITLHIEKEFYAQNTNKKNQGSVQTAAGRQ